MNCCPDDTLVDGQYRRVIPMEMARKRLGKCMSAELYRYRAISPFGTITIKGPIDEITNIWESLGDE